MEAFFNRIIALPLPLASLFFLVLNLFIFALALGIGAWLVRRHAPRRVTAPPAPQSAHEWAYALITVVINTAVTVVGLWLSRLGLLRYRSDAGLHALLDVVVLLLAMDAAMYALHRVAHHPWIFPLLHRPHHRYDRPRPLTLFVLSPPEALAFGGLWLVVLFLYDTSYLGMTLYLSLNVAFGTIGHLGVEPFPSRWIRWPVTRHIGTSTFHALHHREERTNFGFYTLVWDRLLGTLSPAYDRTFELASRGQLDLADRSGADQPTGAPCS
jgi:sterol desaturase/sphingolipid hydroxylase (fatty acid hydroxylase superfamily)